MTWRSLAACRGVTDWFDLPDETTKATCARCPVLEECREHARSLPEPFGVWGGESPEERVPLNSENRMCKVRPRQCKKCGVLFATVGAFREFCSDECKDASERTRESLWAWEKRKSHKRKQGRQMCPLCGETGKVRDGVCQGWECVRIRRLNSGVA